MTNFMNKPLNATGIEDQTDDGRLHWPAPARNKDVILDVLREVLPGALTPGGTILEIGAGSGQHTTHFAPQFPDAVWQATDPDPLHLKSIQAWFTEGGVTNAAKPLYLDTREQPWPVSRADALLCINMIHISPWESCQQLFRGAGEILSGHGILYLYGPFSVGGRHSAPSNAVFSQSLKARDPTWGVRDLDEVTALAEKNGLTLDKTVDMPSNNLSVIYRMRPA